MEKFSGQTLAEFWRHILSGSQVCYCGIQYQLCSIYRRLWGLVVIQQWQNTGRSSQGCPGFNSQWLPAFFTFLYFCFIHLFPGKMLWTFIVRKPLSMGSFLMEKIFCQTLTEFWWHILSGCQVCDWGIQYHLCSTYRGLWGGLVLQLSWLSGRALAAQARGVLGLTLVLGNCAECT